MSPLIWAILILVLGLMLFLLELFIPSAGVLSFLAVMALITSIVTVFRYHGMGVGTVYLTGVCGLLAMLAVLFVRWWPDTPIGRRILNLPRRGAGDEDNSGAQHNPRAQLVGQYGHAKTKMLPSGAIQVAGRTYDAMSEGMAIECGQAVEVIQVRANRILVRPAREIPPTATASKTASAEPLDLVVPDPFDD